MAIPGAEQVDERFLRPQIPLERRSDPINTPTKRRELPQANYKTAPERSKDWRTEAKRLANGLGWLIGSLLKLVKVLILVALLAVWIVCKVIMGISAKEDRSFTRRQH